jgi:hypothetical protein
MMIRCLVFLAPNVTHEVENLKSIIVVVMNIEPENGKQLSVNDQILVQAVSDF